MQSERPSLTYMLLSEHGLIFQETENEKRGAVDRQEREEHRIENNRRPSIMSSRVVEDCRQLVAVCEWK